MPAGAALYSAVATMPAPILHVAPCLWSGAGRVISRRTGIDRRVVGFGGPESSVRYKASLEETVK